MNPTGTSITIMRAAFYEPAVKSLTPTRPYYAAGYGKGRGQLKTASELAQRALLTPLEISDHQLFAYCRHRAGVDAGQQVTHEIPAVDAMRYLECTHAELLKSLERLGKARIQINGVDDRGKPSQFICGYLSSYIRGGLLEFWFDQLLLKYMHEPVVFSLLHLDELRRFRRPESFRLFEYLSIHFGRRDALIKPHALTPAALAYIFGDFRGAAAVKTVDQSGAVVDTLQPQPFWRFNATVLKAAVEEFNQVSLEYNVHAEIRREGRGGKCVEVIFSLHKKRWSLDESVDSPLGPRSPNLLYSRGMIPTQETLWLEAKREAIGRTPVGTRSKRSKRVRSLSDPAMMASHLKISWMTFAPEVQKTVIDIVSEHYDDIQSELSELLISPRNIIGDWLLPAYNVIIARKLERAGKAVAGLGDHFELEQDFVQFVRTKAQLWKLRGRTKRGRTLRAIDMPTAWTNSHLDDNAGPEAEVEALNEDTQTQEMRDFIRDLVDAQPQPVVTTDHRDRPWEFDQYHDPDQADPEE